MFYRLALVFLLAFIPLWGASAKADPATAEAYLALGDFAGARAALGRLVAGRPDAALYMAHLEGLIKLRQGRNEEAAQIFRQILAVEPRYTASRRSLTETLIRLGDVGAAAWHAERLLTVAPDGWERDALAELVSRGQAGKPTGVALRFAVLPSSNVTRGTADRTVEIGGLPFVVDDTSRAKGGIGLSLGASAWVGKQIAPSWTATLGSSVDLKFYEEATEEEANASLRIAFAHATQRTRLSFGPLADIRFNGGIENRRRLGFSAGATRRVTATSEIQGVLSLWHQTYDSQSFRDGTLTEGRIGYRRALSPSTTVSAALTIESERTRRAHLDRDEVGIVLGAEHEWRGGLISGFTVGYRRDEYRGLYPGTAIVRRDDVATLGLALRHRDLQIGRFLPEITYSFTKAMSNISLHTYDAHDVGIALSTNF